MNADDDRLLRRAVQLTGEGDGHAAAGRYHDARRLFRTALDDVSTVLGRSALGPASSRDALLLAEQVHARMGECDLQLNDLEGALQNFRTALGMDLAVLSHSTQRLPLAIRIAAVRNALGDRTGAVDAYRFAVKVAAEIGAGDRLNELGEALWRLGDWAEATNAYRRAIEILERTAPGSKLMARTLSNLAVSRGHSGALDEALTIMRRALKIDEEADPHSTDTGRDLNNLGFILRTRGDLRGALTAYRRAVEIHEAIAPTSMALGTAINNVGRVAMDMGDLEMAETSFRKALDIQQALAPDSVEVAKDKANLALVMRQEGDLRAAGELLRETVAFYASRGLRTVDAAIAMDNLGSVFYSQGDRAQAVRWSREALALVEQVAPNSLEMAGVLQNVGALFQDIGERDQALFYFKQAKQIVENIAPGSAAMASVLIRLGKLAGQMRDFDTAKGTLTEAIQISESIQPRSVDAAVAHQNMAVVLETAGNSAEALPHATLACELFEAIAPGSGELALSLTTRALIVMGDNLDAAIEDSGRAADIAESFRARAGGADARSRIFAELESPHQIAISALFGRNSGDDHVRAFHFAERSRARTLVEMLAERGLEVGRPTNDRSLEQERTLRSRLASVHNRLRAASRNPDSPQELLERLAAEEQDLGNAVADVEERVRLSLPSYADLQYPRPLTLPQVMDRLEDGTLLLEYYAEPGPAFLWAARRTDFVMRRLDLDSDQIRQAVQAAVAMERSSQQAPLVAQARTMLANALLGSVPDQLWQGVERILIVPDGALSYLPFELLALPGGKLLADHYPVSYAPSATVLEELKRLRDTRTGDRREFVGFGDPVFGDSDSKDGTESELRFRSSGSRLRRLPASRDEVTEIAHTFGGSSQIFVGEEATEYRVRTETEGYRFVHFATHGILDDRDPLYSGLALAAPTAEERQRADGLDDFLQVREMFALRLSADVVVCSACQTGWGRIQRGEGLLGMARALYFAGASCVVVSLWPVPDRPTARLMARFYEAMRSGRAPAEALQEAKRSCRVSHPHVYADPYSWAGFVAVGLGW